MRPWAASACAPWARRFPRTLPVMAGYLFLGLAWGIVLREKGFGPEWALLISAAVYAGSMQFAMLGL